VLLDAGDALLVPRPGFPLYTTLAEARGVAVAPYRLLPERAWEADLAEVEAALAAAAARGARAALLLNNPSNPCGSVFSRAHVGALLDLAARFRAPVISDEIYAHVVFSGPPFVSAAAARADVPLLVVGGIAKEFMVPGWRVGWVAAFSEAGARARGGGALAGVRRGLAALSQLTLGASTLAAAALPALLAPPRGGDAEAALAEWRAGTLAQLEGNARAAADALAAVPGVGVVRPAGAMYLMFSVPPPRGARAGARGDDAAFARALLEQEAVFVLPGAAFGAPGWCRVVFTPPREKLAEACARIAAFCAREAAAA